MSSQLPISVGYVEQNNLYVTHTARAWTVCHVSVHVHVPHVSGLPHVSRLSPANMLRLYSIENVMTRTYLMSPG